MPEAVAITIGNFDGVHLGHVQLVRASRAAVAQNGRRGRVVVLSFDPHPMTILRPQAVPPRLSSFEQRSRWLRDAGADEIVALRPTVEFLNQTPQEFLAAVVKNHAPSFIIEGPDFRFGHRRAGSIETLKEMESDYGYRTIVIDPVQSALTDQSIVAVSSSMVRWLLTHGRAADAKVLLTRPYEICGQVVPGDRRGRTIGVPTINIDHQDFLLPADGIYAGVAVLPDQQRFAAAISVGTKPTFGEHARICEAHLIGYQGGLDEYGWTARIEFHHWLRDQLKFVDVDLLTQQIQRDIHKTAELMSIERRDLSPALEPHARSTPQARTHKIQLSA